VINVKQFIYLASSNPGKLREFRDAAAPRGIAVEALPHFDELPVCVEDGTTFEENARKKVLYYGGDFAGPVFADDSGICVDALGGAPGVYSARFAGLDATDAQNNARLLAQLHGIEAELRARTGTAGRPPARFNRAAHYHCIIALADHGRLLTVVEGRADGVIIDAPRGTGGFGYDPYFFYPPLDKTFAEISPEDKFTVAHRGAAFRKLVDYLNSRGK
jgi:XTP/dITP diphosphohydrolase